MFFTTPEARPVEPERVPKRDDPGRFTLTLTPRHRWKVTDRLGVYDDFLGNVGAAKYQREALIAYEAGDAARAEDQARYAMAAELNERRGY